MAERSTEDRIRDKAYEMWQAEGHPHGRDEAHWDAAKEMVATEDSQRATLLPRSAGVGEPVEPPEAFENQGEFPSLTDQGNAERGPSRKATRRTSRSATNQGESAATSLPLGEAGAGGKTAKDKAAGSKKGKEKAASASKSGGSGEPGAGETEKIPRKAKASDAGIDDSMRPRRGRPPKNAAKQPASDVRH